MINRIGMGYGAAGFAAGNNQPAFKGKFLKKIVKKLGIGLTEAEKAARKARKAAQQAEFNRGYNAMMEVIRKSKEEVS